MLASAGRLLALGGPLGSSTASAAAAAAAAAVRCAPRLAPIATAARQVARRSAASASGSAGGRSSMAAAAPGSLMHVERVPPAACGLEPGGVDGAGDSGVRLLRLHYDKMNSLTVDMAAAFEDVCTQLDKDAGMRALVVTGDGRAFSAGGDFNFIEDRIAGDVAENERVLAKFYTTFLAMRKLRVPTIAAINGPAVGGGMGLAMAADMRIASSAARLSFNFVKLGLTPGMASATVLPAATNHQVACRLLLTGDLIDAAEAKEMGLVLQVVEPEQLMETAQRLAGRIASASPSAVSATLALLRERLPWEQLQAAAQAEAALQARFFKARDCREGVDSVRGKRPARFGAPPAAENGRAQPEQ